MAFLRWIFTLPVIVICVFIALANRQAIDFTYSPLHDPIKLELYFVILCALAFGFLMGMILTWLSMGTLRKDRRTLKKEVKTLKKTLETQDQYRLEEAQAVSETESLPRPFNTD